MIGDGSSNTPTGVVHATGANDLTSVTGPTWDEVLQFIAMVDADNALDGSLGWAANPYVVKKLRSTLVAASTDSRMIMEGPNQLAGYPASSTSALPGVAGMSPDDTSYLIFGDWSQLLIGSWTGVDLLANPFETTAYLKGRVLLRAMKDCDVQVRHGEAFAYSNAITIA